MSGLPAALWQSRRSCSNICCSSFGGEDSGVDEWQKAASLAITQTVYFSLWLLCFKNAPKPIQFVVPLLWAGSVSCTVGYLEHTQGKQGSCVTQGLQQESTDGGGACIVAAAGWTQELV